MAPPAQVVMIIRHAEKPMMNPHTRGVTLMGKPDRGSLSPIGWVRAGALLGLFAPEDPDELRPGLYRPASLFASNTRGDQGSDREEQTLAPLAARLGIPTDRDHAVGQERELVRAVQSAASPALICWEHRRLPSIGALLGSEPTVPERWPKNRYDQVWVFTRESPEARYAFTQIPQRQMPGDSETPI